MRKQLLNLGKIWKKKDNSISETKKKLQRTQKKIDSNEKFVRDTEKRLKNKQENENDKKGSGSEKNSEIRHRQRRNNICNIGVPKEGKENK